MAWNQKVTTELCRTGYPYELFRSALLWGSVAFILWETRKQGLGASINTSSLLYLGLGLGYLVTGADKSDFNTACSAHALRALRPPGDTP